MLRQPVVLTRRTRSTVLSLIGYADKEAEISAQGTVPREQQVAATADAVKCFRVCFAAIVFAEAAVTDFME